MTTPNQGGAFTPQPGQPTTPPPTASPTPGMPAQPPGSAPGTPPPTGAPGATKTGSSPLDDLAANRPLLIAGGVGLVAVIAVIGIFLSGGPKNDVTSTQQLTANAPGATQQAQADVLPDGFERPAPDATGRIIDTEELTVDREAAEVTIAKVDPSTYVQIGEWWARANEEGKIYLPPGKGLADAVFFSADDQTVPYAGQATEESGSVTSVTFAKGVAGGFNLSPGAQVWYTNASFQSDPAYILIPRGLEGSFEVYVGSAPIELALP